MKKNLVKMAAAAAVAMFVQVAGAQTFTGRMKAEVPFAFQAGKATLTPGAYEVTMGVSNAGTTMLHVVHMNPYQAIAVTIPQPYKKIVRDEAPAIVFSCAGENCVLHSVRVQSMEYGTGMKNKLTAAERERLFTIRLTPTQGRSAE